MKKGGLADSPFFRLPQYAAVAPTRPQKPQKKPKSKVTPRNVKVKQTSQSNHDTVIPRHHETMLDTVIPQYQATIFEAVRKAVKEFGKEAATYRFTVQEKKSLKNIIYVYSGQEIKTSENEIARIAINFIVSDYYENGESSVLHKVMLALKK